MIKSTSLLLAVSAFSALALAQHSQMDMNMNMGHGDMGGGHGGGSPGGHSMAMVFFNAIDTPLFSNAWTPKNRGQYAGTCIFLILLTIAYRAMTAGKHMVENAWVSQAHRRHIIVAGADSEQGRPNPALGSDPAGNEAGRTFKDHGPAIQPWRLSVDLPRSLMTLIITAVGYLLMLAVMTMNIGYFFSVLAGAFLGELVLGRFGSAVDHHNH